MSHIKYMCWRAPLSATPYHACGRAAATGTSASSVPSASLWLATALSAARSTAAAGGGGSCRRWQLPEWPHTSAPTPLVFAVRFQSGVAGACEAPNGGSGDSSKGLQEAEALLRERFGPQAKLVLRRCPRRRPRRSAPPPPEGEEEEEAVVEEEEPVAGTVAPGARGETAAGQLQPSQGVMEYRASATCRLLGFPVELAAAGGLKADEVLGRVLHEALESDVVFIHPQQRGGGAASSQSTRGHGRGNQRRSGYRQNNSTHALSPRQMELKAIMDELRELCVHFSRVLKFSIKFPRNNPQQEQQQQQQHQQPKQWDDGSGTQGEWRCRAYVRDEWGVAPNLSFTAEARGQSANDSLMRCLAMLRDRYRAELESPAVQLESVREVEAFIHPWGKTVESHCFEEGTTDDSSEAQTSAPAGQKNDKKKKKKKNDEDSSHEAGAAQPVPVEEQYRVLRPTTFTAAVIVEDAQGNISVSQVKRQATPLVAYQSASVQALRVEAGLVPDVTIMDQCLPPVPLLLRMRWQLDAMVQRLAQLHSKRPEEVATIRIEGESGSGDKNTIENGKSDLATKNEEEAEISDKQCVFFNAYFISEGSVVWQQSGQGRYRLEFDCYVQALTYLLDQYPEVGLTCFDTCGGGALFPTTKLLELAVMKHDNYNVGANHRGKWNVYALLGTLTSQLIGSFYQTTYHADRATGEARAVLTVNDGLRSNQLLIQRQAKKRGEAWRSACLDALRENFPNQYRDALLLHPDLDLSGDTMARGSRYRALPREKRVEHIGNIFSLVAAFAEEDLGWHNLRVRLRNASADLGLPQWVAEMEAQIEGEEQRRVVAISPPYSQVKHARRVLVYQLAQKYFPKELQAYAKLNRGDAVNPDQDARNTDNTVYRAGTESFVNQVMMLLEERAPAMAPFSWTLEQHVDSNTESTGNDGSVEYLLHPFSPRFRAAVYGMSGDMLISERLGTEDESAVGVLCSALRAATNRLAGAKGEQLWTEYECHAPPPIATSRELSLYMFNAFFGVSKLGMVTDAESLSTASSAEQQVVDIDARELGGYWFVTLSLSRAGDLAVARAIATAKREGIRDVMLLACRRSFPRALQYLAAHSREVGSFAAEIFASPVVEALPDAVLHDIKHGLERAEAAGPPRPYTLLRRCVTREFRNERWLRVEQMSNSGNGFQCRIYLQKHRRESKKGEVQLVGFGAALSRSQALHIASLCALENLFESDLAAAVARSPGYRDLPSLE